MTEKQAMLNAEYRAVRKNYLRNIRRMESKGYTFDRDMRPSIPKKITPASIRKIEKLNAKRYDYAHISESDRAQKRSEAAKKGWQTRKARDAMLLLDQLGGALGVMADEAGEEKSQYTEICMATYEELYAECQNDPDRAIEAADYIESVWGDIQKAFDTIINDSDLVNLQQAADEVVIHLKRAAGKPVTLEDMRAAGDYMEALSAEPDYYPA